MLRRDGVVDADYAQLYDWPDMGRVSGRMSMSTLAGPTKDQEG